MFLNQILNADVTFLSRQCVFEKYAKAACVRKIRVPLKSYSFRCYSVSQQYVKDLFLFLIYTLVIKKLT